MTIVDGDLRYLEHPDPVPGDTELVVAVRAAGINNADLMQRLGFYPAPAGLAPRHPGHGARRGGRRHGAPHHSFLHRRSRHGGGGWRCAGRARRRGRAHRHAGASRRALARSGRISRGLLHRLRRPVHPVRSRRRRARPRHRRGGRGRERRRCSWSRPPVPSCVASVRHAQLRDAVATLGPGPPIPTRRSAWARSTWPSSSSGRRASRACSGPWPSTGRIVVIGVGGGARAEIDLLAIMHRRLRISGSTLRSRTLIDKAVVAARGRTSRRAPSSGSPGARAARGDRSHGPRRRGVRALRPGRQARQDRPRPAPSLAGPAPGRRGGVAERERSL